MKKIVLLFALLLTVSSFLFSCEDIDDTVVVPKLIIKFKFDSTKPRLNNLGNPTAMATGRAGQNPVFNFISAHYLELAQDENTQLGNGSILYHAQETTLGGATAIDFSKSIIVKENETFLEIPLNEINSGKYEWFRASLSYQNYQINVRYKDATNTYHDYPGTLASFVGFNTYIGSYSIGNNFFDINGNRSQGYWGFALNDYPFSTSGQSASTTVPNPLSATSPIPAGSCVVTGKFPSALVITGEETKDIVVTLTLSTNKSFEWQEVTFDGKYEPVIGESVVDMGLRGLFPTFTK